MQQLVKELGRLVESVPQVRTLPALARLLDQAIAGLQQGAGPAVTFAVPIQVSQMIEGRVRGGCGKECGGGLHGDLLAQNIRNVCLQLRCACALCGQLQAFLHSPTEKSMEIQENRPKTWQRRHLMECIGDPRVYEELKIVGHRSSVTVSKRKVRCHRRLGVSDAARAC
jgi:hypothetical protein